MAHVRDLNETLKLSLVLCGPALGLVAIWGVRQRMENQSLLSTTFKYINKYIKKTYHAVKQLGSLGDSMRMNTVDKAVARSSSEHTAVLPAVLCWDIRPFQPPGLQFRLMPLQRPGYPESWASLVPTPHPTPSTSLPHVAVARTLANGDVVRPTRHPLSLLRRQWEVHDPGCSWITWLVWWGSYAQASAITFYP